MKNQKENLIPAVQKINTQITWELENSFQIWLNKNSNCMPKLSGTILTMKQLGDKILSMIKYYGLSLAEQLLKSDLKWVPKLRGGNDLEQIEESIEIEFYREIPTTEEPQKKIDDDYFISTLRLTTKEYLKKKKKLSDISRKMKISGIPLFTTEPIPEKEIEEEASIETVTKLNKMHYFTDLVSRKEDSKIMELCFFDEKIDPIEVFVKSLKFLKKASEDQETNPLIFIVQEKYLITLISYMELVSATIYMKQQGNGCMFFPASKKIILKELDLHLTNSFCNYTYDEPENNEYKLYACYWKKIIVSNSEPTTVQNFWSKFHIKEILRMLKNDNINQIKIAYCITRWVNLTHINFAKTMYRMKCLTENKIMKYMTGSQKAKAEIRSVTMGKQYNHILPIFQKKYHPQKRYDKKQNSKKIKKNNSFKKWKNPK